VFVLRKKYHHALLNNYTLTGREISTVIPAVSLIRTIACKIITDESDLDHVVELTFATVSRTAPNSRNTYEYAGQVLRIAIDHALLLRDAGRPDMQSAKR
jgi:formaldehyde-activating enzyme involved in methanogenesis